MLNLSETQWNHIAGGGTVCGPAGRCVLVGIAGGSGAGKSRLARQFEDALDPETTILALDDFYRDLSKLPLSVREQVNFDDPEALDWNLLLKALKRCRAGLGFRAPRYDFATHTRREHGLRVVPRGVIIVEGLWALLKPEVRALFDFRIFLECPARVRLERRLVRDASERGRDPESIRRQFRESVLPMHNRFVAPQADWADLVLNQAPTSHGIEYLANRFRAMVNEPRVQALDGVLAEVS